MKSVRGPVAILFATLVIVMLGFGIVMPIMPFYVTHFGASGQAVGLLMALYSIMQFIFAPVWGRLSDRIGRKPVFLIGLFGYLVSFIIQALAQNLGMLYVARALAGILSSATLPTALAFIADKTTSENRSSGMGLMGAAMGLGMVFGPLLGGPLTQVVLPLPPALESLMQYGLDPATGARLDFSFPFLVSAGLALITIPFAIFNLPESLPPEKRTAHHEPGPSRLTELASALRGPMAFLFVTSFLLAFAMANLEGILGLFAKDRFAMGPADVGLIMGLIGVLSVVQQGALIGPLTRWIGEERVLQWGLVVSVIGLVGIAVVPDKWGMIVMACVFNTGNSLLRPSVASLISQRAETGQGVAMGLENSFMSLGRATGPIWAGFAYDIHFSWPFWSAALVQAVAFVLSFWLMREPRPSAVKPKADVAAG